MKALLNGKLFDRDKVKIICHIKIDNFFDIFIKELCKTEKGEYILVKWSTIEGVFIDKAISLKILSRKEVLDWYENIQNKGYEIHNEDILFNEIDGKVEEI